MKQAFYMLLVFFALPCVGKSLMADSTVTQVNGSIYPWNTIKPGDTLWLQGSLRQPIQFVNLSGKAEKPVFIFNKGKVKIETNKLPYGISLRNCHYLVVSGNGNQNGEMSIVVSRVNHDGAGIGISDRSDNIELCFIEIANTKGPGILCKTDADCTTSKTTYTGHNYSIHNNYIHHTGTEGLYIGSSFFAGEKIKCNGRDTTILPPVMDGIKIYSNRVEYTGWDCIQVGNCINVDCHDNKAFRLGQANDEWQNSGLMIGGGTQGRFYKNQIDNQKGNGITCFGNKFVEVTQNTIRVSANGNYAAIYVNDKLSFEKTDYYIEGNKFINSNNLPIKTVFQKKFSVPHIADNTVSIPTN